MNLKDISLEINDLLEKRRKELELTFIEEEHIYYMKDLDGEIKRNFPSVSKIVKKFHKSFDAEGMALKMSKGDPEGQAQLLAEWKQAGDLSTNMGSRVHFELESDLIDRYGSYKEVRQPLFEIDEIQKNIHQNLVSFAIYCGNKYYYLNQRILQAFSLLHQISNLCPLLLQHR